MYTKHMQRAFSMLILTRIFISYIRSRFQYLICKYVISEHETGLLFYYRIFPFKLILEYHESIESQILNFAGIMIQEWKAIIKGFTNIQKISFCHDNVIWADIAVHFKLLKTIDEGINIPLNGTLRINDKVQGQTSKITAT